MFDPCSYLAIFLSVEFVFSERVSCLVCLELLLIEIVVLNHLARLTPRRQAVVLPVVAAGESCVIGGAVVSNGLGPQLSSLRLLLLMLLVLVMLLRWRLLLLLVMMMRRVYRQHGVQGGVVVVCGGSSHGLHLPAGVPRHGHGDWPGLLVLLAGRHLGGGGRAAPSAA